MHKTHASVGRFGQNGLLQLNARSLQVAMAGNAEAVKNHPGSARLIERIEMDTGNIVSQKIMALLQCVLNANVPNHVWIILARL